MQNANRDLATTQTQFWKYYNSDLREIYQKLEPLRKEYLKTFLKRFAFFGCLYFLIFIMCRIEFIPQSIYNNKNIFSYFTFAVLVSLIYIFAPFSSYRKKTKTMAMKKLLSFWGSFNYYNEKHTIYQSEIEKSELFTCYNREEIDDAFAGKYKNSSIAVSEHVLYLKGNRGDFYTFKGILILLKFNKNFKGKTVVRAKSRWINVFFNNPFFSTVFGLPLFLLGFLMLKDGDFLSFIQIIGGTIAMLGLMYALVYICYSFKHKKKAKKEITLEGIPFLRRWNVTSDNQVEARYILTPVLMENLLKIKKLFHGKHIDFSFFDDKLLIAVHTRKNMFETTSLLTSALNYSRVREVVSQLYSIFKVIDILNIQNKPSDK